ncbi:phosphoribosylglycinamide formyltransferase [Ornithinimicrobium pratense]|uniref:Phosphoribosylglycinamide formyltransferase n=1 Tax=Ornithinimicrobium pratense TaxID=2593973 RepID=A0A5J6V565_9MICO|nr:phosphoribosylglycinamide formyltransferase [Ornithinimicrobium pratense]QFG69130.1 phosphoribosylglycinamide formyltransferase [Ornithinimicrobium pratense]
MSSVTPAPRTPVVVLVSGSGTLLQAVLDASADPGYGVEVVAVGADRDGIEGLARARRHGIPTFVERLQDHPDRASWDQALADAIGAYAPDLVVCAGFMKIVGDPALSRFRIVNTHPALLPSFPGAHGVRDALAHGVKVTGATLFEVDAGIDTGGILAQRAVEVREDDTEESLHERIKVVERAMLVTLLPQLVRQTGDGPDTAARS